MAENSSSSGLNLDSLKEELDATKTTKTEEVVPPTVETPEETPEETPKDEPSDEQPKGPNVSALLQNFTNDIQVKLADRQADPNSPLYSVKSFDDLNLREDLIKGIYNMGFQKPSKIQERALPLLLQNPPRNMIGQSQSGTGKTAAFVLNMLSRVDYEIQKTQAICLAPSRELARQIMDVVDKMGALTPVTKCFASKGTWSRGSKIDAQIIVGTPGTLLDMLRNRAIDPSNVAVLVLDEADNMLDQGSMGDQSISIKNQLSKFSKGLQIVLFSATFNDSVRNFAAKFAPQANEIRLKQEELSLDAIKQFFMDCKSEDHKYEVLAELYGLLTIGQSIIFVASRESADKIAKKLTDEGHKTVSLHGQIGEENRDQVMDSFREGKTKVLIATNVIARGIDVLQVNMVVNYDLPLLQNGQADLETYIHRIGRTGRFGRQGLSINFVHNRRSFEIMSSIEKQLGKKIYKVDTNDFDEMEKTLNKIIKS